MLQRSRRANIHASSTEFSKTSLIAQDAHASRNYLPRPIQDEALQMPEQPAGNGQRPGGQPRRLGVYFAKAAIGLSLFAVAIILGNVAAGAPPQNDENTWAHLFQLSMAAQVPLILLFLVSADWTRRGRVIVLLCAQVFAAAAAFGALAWSGY